MTMFLSLLNEDVVAGWAGAMGRACWQGGLLILLVWGLCRLLLSRRGGAPPRQAVSVRYWFWWLACLKLVAGLVCAAAVSLPVLPRDGFDLGHHAGSVRGITRRLQVRPSPRVSPEAAASVSETRKASPSDDAPPNVGGARGEKAVAARPAAARAAAPLLTNELQQPRWSLVFFAAWLAGVALFGSVGLRGYVRLKRALRQDAPRQAAPASAEAAADETERAAQRLAARLGLRRAPAIRHTAAVATPFVVGLVRPVIVVPENFGQVLTPGERELALAHELAHLRRADLWLGLVPLTARTLFWFFPPAWLACREWATAREEAADLAALRVTGAPAAVYGQLLLKMTLRQQRQNGGAGALAAGSAAGLAPGYRALKRRLATVKAVVSSATVEGGRGSRRRAASVLAPTFALAVLGLIPWRLATVGVVERAAATPRALLPPAAPMYDVVDLGTLGGNFSEAYAVNDRGQVVGVANPSPERRRGHAFLWQNGRMVDLGVLPKYRRSAAVGINNGGQVIAASYNRYDFHHAFVWEGEARRPLGPTLPGYRYVRALGMNDYGEVVGNAQTGTRDRGGALVARAFLWVEGHTVGLGTLGGRYSHALAINNRGQVVGKAELPRRTRAGVRGTHAFLWQPDPARETGTMRDLGVLPGGLHSVAHHVNDRGDVVGFSESAGGSRAFAWSSRTERMRDLGTLPGDRASLARAANAQGLVVGYSDRGEPLPGRGGDGKRAVLWRLADSGGDAAATLQDLNGLLPPGSPWLLEEARGINDRGQIVGRGLIRGERHAFLLTPRNPAPLGGPGGPTRVASASWE